MRRTVALLAVVVVCFVTFTAQGSQERYQAMVRVDFQLRDKPQENGKRLILVAEGSEVTVSEYREEWSRISVNNKTGYAKSEWLSKFISLDPITSPVPGHARQSGLARINSPVMVSVPGYSGNTLKPGDMIAVRNFGSKEAVINMMRDMTTVPVAAVHFEAFTPWESAQPGDLLSAFTTYYNTETGGRLSSNRALNIELASDRIQNVTLKSQEQFSFNVHCAPYKKSNGYLMAPNISNDGKGYGGGVCQLSTTLYNAVLGLPIQIDQWRVHRERGVDYIAQYFDAAVGSYSDLAFTNLLPYTISLEVLTQDGALTALIRRHHS